MNIKVHKNNFVVLRTRYRLRLRLRLRRNITLHNLLLQKRPQVTSACGSLQSSGK